MRGGRILFCSIALIALSALVFFLSHLPQRLASDPIYGFTFSFERAESLGLHPQEVLDASLQDFHPAFVRLPLYWTRVEAESNIFSWDESDDAIGRIRKSGADVHLVVGAKVPRWPECFVPSWVDVVDRDVYRQELLAYVDAVVMRYASVVDVWQVENEPFFTFGNCPAADIDLLKEEIEAVRKGDPDAQIQLTVSGEQELWTSVASLTDRIGVSMYRKTHSAFFGSVSFPLPSWWYALMRVPLLPMHDVVLAELQMEPWFVIDPRSLEDATVASLFTAQDAVNTLTYARSVGFSEISFWGVEWWYYLRQQGYGEVWEGMREEMK